MIHSSESSNKTSLFIKRVKIPSEVHDVFNYHARSGAIDRLIPPWSFLKVIKRNHGLENESISILALQYGPLKSIWIAKHIGYVQDKVFQDEMIKGPLNSWEHTHSFAYNQSNGCIMEDKIKYSLPYGLNRIEIFKDRVNKTLYQMFSYRHRILQNDLKLWSLLKDSKGKRILISGSTG